MKKIILIGWLVAVACIGNAQELNCSVTVNSDKIQGSNKQVFSTLQQAIQDFVNNTRWTNLTFATSERIDCSMFIVVSSVADNVFSCELTCQSKRPVYNTNYFSPILNFKDDKFTFKYEEFDRLEYRPTGFDNNLSALLSYYCLLIIGFDMDSYARLGGTPYFQQCENIVSLAQSASFESAEMTGWRAFDSNKNRYAIINNLMDEAFKPLREFFYEYHRLLLDQLAQNVPNTRKTLASKLPVLKETFRTRQNSYLVYLLLDAKNDELVNIFSKGTDKEKADVYELLVGIDPTRQQVYDKLKK